MDKKQLHHLWTRLKRIKVWYMVAALIISLGVSVVALRQNNLGMARLRNAVYQADERAGNVEVALQQLRSYVYSHMNTNLASGDNAVYPPVQLKYTYQRLKQAQNSQAQQANAQVYTDAQNHCERLYPGSFSGGPRVPCIESYVASHGVKVQKVPDALYKFAFVSPSWSPDLAGFGLLVSLLLALALLIRVGLDIVLRKLVH
jgi:hypothetical protein